MQVRHIDQKCSTLLTSQLDEQPSRSSATADLLASIDTPQSYPQRTERKRSSPPSYENPIRNSRSFHKPKPLPGSGDPEGNRRLLSLIGSSARKNEKVDSENTFETLQKINMAMDLTKQITRRWKTGDIYAPHDLSDVEMRKWKSRSRPVYDVFDVLDFNPVDHYRVCHSATSRIG